MTVFILFFFVIVLLWKVAMDSIIQTIQTTTLACIIQNFSYYIFIYLWRGKEVHVSHNDPMGVREKLMEDNVSPRDQTH